MNKFTKLGIATALVMGVSAQASAFSQFKINAQSNGFAGVDATALEYLDFIGNSFIQNAFNGPVAPGANFTFDDKGVFKVTGVDGAPKSLFGGAEITATFVGAGTGTLGGAINFTGGTLTFYSDVADDYATSNGIYGADNGTAIGTFSLTSGSAAIDNNAVPNGFITLAFQASNLLANTWFDLAGNDLSLAPSTLGFVTSNATRLETASALLQSEVVCQQSGVNCPSGNPFNNAPTQFLVSNNGQYRMQTTAIPEPASLAILGIGFIGFALRKQRRG
jgi:PEP-CTERM motif